jgi:hypothetical protein
MFPVNRSGAVQCFREVMPFSDDDSDHFQPKTLQTRCAKRAEAAQRAAIYGVELQPPAAGVAVGNRWVDMKQERRRVEESDWSPCRIRPARQSVKWEMGLPTAS